MYMDKSANMEMAKRVVLDAKIDYPAACNAMVLVHSSVFFYSLLVSIATLFMTFSMDIILSLICTSFLVVHNIASLVPFFSISRKHFLCTRIWCRPLGLMSLLLIFALKVGIP